MYIYTNLHRGATRTMACWDYIGGCLLGKPMSHVFCVNNQSHIIHMSQQNTLPPIVLLCEYSQNYNIIHLRQVLLTPSTSPLRIDIFKYIEQSTQRTFICGPSQIYQYPSPLFPISLFPVSDFFCLHW